MDASNALPVGEQAQKKPTTIFLKDYQPPIFSVSTVELTIQIFNDETIVETVLEMQRQTSGAIELYGRELELLDIWINEKQLSAADYKLDNESLVIANAPDKLTLKTKVRILPQNNTSLEGLYLAGASSAAEAKFASGDAMYVTQCEPEGFRKICYFPDRPDVMAEFTTRLEADKKLPTLLANGNLIEQGDLSDNRHFAIWHDPTRKPSYLFACVAADLSLLKDAYITSEGREVTLALYAAKADIEKCHVAMQALKDSMRWDEDHYGRAYDLDSYMIVATSTFNMGAMENKGLNIFNTAAVLSSPEATTDVRNLTVKSIIAHEYFHNWTGNRITCRDWFQLCLKEGFTVFRDQSFTTTVQSEAVQRIDDVSALKARQFPEDAGPLSHPPRPDHFVEINNFYTATVYEKGAEIARMISRLLGREAFRRGTDSYFERFDGMAVTVEDFLDALSDSGTDVRHFLNWYTQPGTPKVTVTSDINEDEVVLHLNQSTRHVDGYNAPKALPIPVDVALFDAATGELKHTETLMLANKSQSFTLPVESYTPKLSLLRGFSAPVNLVYDYSDEDLAFLIEHETDGFNQWQAAQTLVQRYFSSMLKGVSDSAEASKSVYVAAMQRTLPALSKSDPLLATRLLDLPSENQLASTIESDYNPSDVKAYRDALKLAVATALKDFIPSAYALYPIKAYEDTSKAMGQRAWRNLALALAFKASLPDAQNWAVNQYETAVCMTERLGALQQLVWNQDKLSSADIAEEKLQDFYNRFQDDELVIDMWFGVQAANPAITLDDINALLEHPRFDYGVPNRIRSVASHLAGAPTKVWSAPGIDFFVALTQVLDEKNPILASRILQVLSRWYTLSNEPKTMIKAKLEALQASASSPSVVESLNNMLKA